ncbi:SDR family oxidoreductase [Methylobacterium sp. WL30]|uniref:SDR family oxidoreductase n=2 Tax=Methylobacterium TaxID=407 RepID=UPI0011C740A8|nr:MULTISPECIES: SDR family oxidoreductase [unclassified Methylobacterium]MCJ2077787.1 SDR family oxidoreductase [Methylobacterium sp. E-016]TXN40461.1 SDR family oxidoreductase [Methylobacterium sp. WL93]TXN49170.1 SDR family oxidoreductase [Methylobacterium sp. WL119]TXN63740.1 SDR family oxidoreductase [Methylobacterium sp. WL30]
MGGRVALVTGAASGLGRVVALALGRAGYAVVLAGRRRAALDAVAGEIGAALVVEADVTDPASVDRLFSRVAAAHGRLDLLFNNAGIFTPAAAIDAVSLEDWRASVDTNLTGAFLCTQGAFRMMKRQDPRGGRIINNGSVSAHVPRPHSAPYAATKHAVTGLTRATSLDGRPYDIACGQIDIGNAATEMTDGFAAGVRQADGSIRQEPVMDARHVAEAVLYMAGLPLSANVQFMTLTATAMPFIGRG